LPYGKQSALPNGRAIHSEGIKKVTREAHFSFLPSFTFKKEKRRQKRKKKA
jgi:hypothetical protein